MDHEPVIDIRSNIVTKRIIELLKGFNQFSDSFNKIDEDIQDELLNDLEELVSQTLNDPTIGRADLADVIARKIFDSFSDRRGLRQGFFDAMPLDDEHRELMKKKKADDEAIEVGRPSPHLPPTPPKPTYIDMTHEELRRKIADVVKLIIK